MDQTVAGFQLGIDFIHSVPKKCTGMDTSISGTSLPAAGKATFAIMNLIVSEIDGLCFNVTDAFRRLQRILKHPIRIGILPWAARNAEYQFLPHGYNSLVSIFFPISCRGRGILSIPVFRIPPYWPLSAA